MVIDASSYCSICEKYFSPGEKCDDPIENRKVNCNICKARLDVSKLKEHVCFHTIENVNHLSGKKIPRRRKSLRLNKRDIVRRSNRRGLTGKELLKKVKSLNDSNVNSSISETVCQQDENSQVKQDPAQELDICIFCSKEIPLNLLEEHENAHREEEKLRAKQHRIHIPKDGTTICTICGAAVSCKDLKKHERTHRRLDTVICSICGFPAKNIYQHMATHSEERRFACQECGLAFKHKKNLDAHMLVHETVGKHKCPTCEKAFKTPYNLRVHIRSHQDVKPFPCQYCDKTFTTKQSRDNHMKTHITNNL